jgi:hypothetical protein
MSNSATGPVLRRFIGYDRYCTRAAFLALKAVHELLRPYVNFFQPVRKLVSKSATAPGSSSGTTARRRPTAGCWPAGSSPQRAATRSPRSITGSIHSSCAPNWQPALTRSGNSQTGRRGAPHEHPEASRRSGRARPRDRQGQLRRTVGDTHFEASAPRSVTRTFEASRAEGMSRQQHVEFLTEFLHGLRAVLGTTFEFEQQCAATRVTSSAMKSSVAPHIQLETVLA